MQSRDNSLYVVPGHYMIETRSLRHKLNLLIKSQILLFFVITYHRVSVRPFAILVKFAENSIHFAFTVMIG